MVQMILTLIKIFSVLLSTPYAVLFRITSSENFPLNDSYDYIISHDHALFFIELKNAFSLSSISFLQGIYLRFQLFSSFY